MRLLVPYRISTAVQWPVWWELWFEVVRVRLLTVGQHVCKQRSGTAVVLSLVQMPKSDVWWRKQPYLKQRNTMGDLFKPLPNTNVLFLLPCVVPVLAHSKTNQRNHQAEMQQFLFFCWVTVQRVCSYIQCLVCTGGREALEYAAEWDRWWWLSYHHHSQTVFWTTPFESQIHSGWNWSPKVIWAHPQVKERPNSRLDWVGHSHSRPSSEERSWSVPFMFPAALCNCWPPTSLGDVTG